MFLLRGVLIAVCEFVLVYAVASVAVAGLWRAMARLIRPLSATPNLWFAVRMMPAALATFTVAVFTVPSFLRFEPRGSEEAIGTLALLLATAFLLLLGNGISRAWLALWHTTRCVRRWMTGGVCEQPTGGFIVAGTDAPPVALAGVGKSKLLISAAARATLTDAEMERAVAHEMAHRRSADNLKKLLLRVCSFPGMRSLERAWLEAIEIAADAEAVHSQAEALDLASALVKIARLHDGRSLPELASGLADGPHSSLQVRVERLLRWRAHASSTRTLRPLQVAAFAMLLFVTCCYGPLLHSVHVVSELLLR